MRALRTSPVNQGLTAGMHLHVPTEKRNYPINSYKYQIFAKLLREKRIPNFYPFKDQLKN